jgi:hypothetical protein
MLRTSLEQLAFIITKARAFDGEVDPVDGDPGAQPADDQQFEVLQDTPDNPTVQELRGSLLALDREQRAEVLALMWIGSGDFSKEEWREAFSQAVDRGNEREIDYLIGTPLLGDYLEEALSQFGLSIAEYEMNRL